MTPWGELTPPEQRPALRLLEARRDALKLHYRDSSERELRAIEAAIRHLRGES